MITCSKKITFEAAHRILGHEGNCKFLHGHRYVCSFMFTAPALDELGRVIDFSIIKEIMVTWIKENWDHNVILWEKDVALTDAIVKNTAQKVYKMSGNPTAENMAEHLLRNICPQLFKDHRATCIEVTVEETENNSVCSHI